MSPRNVATDTSMDGGRVAVVTGGSRGAGIRDETDEDDISADDDAVGNGERVGKRDQDKIMILSVSTG